MAAGGQQILQEVERILKGLSGLVSDGPKQKADPAPAPAADAVPSQIGDIVQEIADVSGGMQDVRNDLSAFGKRVGAIATGVLGAIGYTRIHSIFPFPDGAPGWLAPGAVAAAVCGVGASTFLVIRFFFAKRRILVEPPTKPPPEHEWWHALIFWNKEQWIVERVAQRYARAEGKSTLQEVADEATELAAASRQQRLAGEAEGADQRWNEAYRLEKVVDLALWDASSQLLERRTRGAFGGPVASLAILLAVGGVGFVFATADWASGRRSLPAQKVREAEACVARAAASTDPQIKALAKACIAKAASDLGTTATTTTTTTTTSTTTGG